MTDNGNLYICPTPIGNLKDITLRAIDILKNCDLILCEDTRKSQKLLKHYDIKTKTQSYHKFNEKGKTKEIISKLKSGKNIVLISDAGTPLISDPGEELVLQAMENDLKITPLPGASALTTFLSAIYNPYESFTFVGFLPRKKSEKHNIFKKYYDSTVIFYESPNRIIKTLKELQEISPRAQIAIGRELTKIYEEINQSDIQKIINHYLERDPKGEIVAAVIPEKIETKLEPKITDSIFKLEKQGYNINEISKILAVIFNLPKKEIYKEALNLIKKQQ